MGFWNNETGSSTNTTSSPSSTTPTREGGQGNQTAPRSHTGSFSRVGDRSAEIEDKLNERFGKPRSALGPGTVVQGKLSFDTPVRIDGKLTGEIVSTKAVIIGVQGIVEAQLNAEAVIVLGKVKGDVVARERIEILAGGSIEGSIKSPLFLLEEGGLFNGSCSMEAPPQPVPAKETPKAASSTAAAPNAPAQGATAGTEKDKEKEKKDGEKDARPNPAMH